jgi:hypothetical protein
MNLLAEFQVALDKAHAVGARLSAENARLAADYTKLSRQLDDALDGIADLKLKVKELEQLNTELREMKTPTGRKSVA